MRLVLRALVLLLLVAVLAVGGLVWRVRRGPVALDFLVPRLKAALALDEEWRVDVEALELVWRAAARQTELRARGLRIARPKDGASVTLAGARIRLKRRALLRGEVEIVAIELDAPSLQLARDAEGRFAARLDAPEAGARDLGWLYAMIQRLEHVAVRNGRIAFIDEASGTVWTVPHLDGDVWRTAGPLSLQANLTLAAGDATIPLWVDALYRFDPGTLTVQVSSAGADTAAAFAAWPSTLAAEAHAWVTSRLQNGRIGDSVLMVAGHVVRNGQPKLVIDTLDASVDFEALSVRYLDTMPRATDVAGNARFTRESVDVAVTRGQLDALTIGPARVRVAWPKGARDHIAIDARCRGPLASLVAVLDHEPVALGQRLSFQTQGIAGTTATRIRLAFPLEGEHRLGTLGLRATSTVTDGAVPYVAGDWQVGRANVTVSVDDRALAVQGTAALRGIPVALRYRHHFDRRGARRLDVTGRLAAADRQALGIEAERWLSGPVDARLRLMPRPDGRLVASVGADLTPASLTAGVLAIDKPPDVPGRATARFGIARGLVTAVDRFELSADAVTVRGNASRSPGGGAWSRADAAVTFALPDRPDDEGAMQVALEAQDDGWHATVTSRNLGLVLRGYGSERVRGGKARLDGRLERLDGSAPFTGEITVEDATISQVPWLVKLVSLASIRGLSGLGSEQTVVLDRVVATLARREPDRIQISDGVARGPQMGLTLDGTWNHAQDTLDLRGTVVPSYYFLNEGVEQIPVIGDIIGLATGGALQAVTFTVRGPRNEASVAVQPLSSLAPGVLREWLRKLGL